MASPLRCASVLGARSVVHETQPSSSPPRRSRAALVRRPSCVENFFDRFESVGAVGTGHSGSVAYVAARSLGQRCSLHRAWWRSVHRAVRPTAAHAERGRALRAPSDARLRASLAAGFIPAEARRGCSPGSCCSVACGGFANPPWRRPRFTGAFALRLRPLPTRRGAPRVFSGLSCPRRSSPVANPLCRARPGAL
jgi:hypothetical protein